MMKEKRESSSLRSKAPKKRGTPTFIATNNQQRIVQWPTPSPVYTHKSSGIEARSSLPCLFSRWNKPRRRHLISRWGIDVRVHPGTDAMLSRRHAPLRHIVQWKRNLPHHSCLSWSSLSSATSTGLSTRRRRAQRVPARRVGWFQEVFQRGEGSRARSHEVLDGFAA